MNVGVGLLSTSGRQPLNTTKLMATSWPGSGLLVPRPEKGSSGAPVGGRLPMGLAVGPRVGPDSWSWRCRGLINPFNGEGIAYAYETAAGRRCRLDALEAGDEICRRLQQSLQDIYGMYYRVARAFIGVLSRPPG